MSETTRANANIGRRSFLKAAAVGSIGALAAACTPPPIPAQQRATEGQAVSEVPRAEPRVEITYWQAPIFRFGKDNKTPDAPVDEWLNYSIEKFEAANPDVKVNLEIIPWENWGPKVGAAVASATVPNLLYGAPTQERVLLGIYDPIDEYVTDEVRRQWHPNGVPAMTVFGRVYGIPTFSDPNAYILSKTALEKFGGAEHIPSDDMRGLTIQSLEKMAEAFSDGKERFMMGIPVGDHPGSIYFDMAHAFIGRGVQFWDENWERFIAHEHPRAEEALQWFVDAQKKGWLVPNLPKMSDINTFLWQMKVAGRGGWMGIQAQLAAAQAAGQAPQEFELFLCSHPYDEKLEPHAAGLNGFNGFVLGKTTDPKKREAAFRLGNWYATEPEVGETWLVNGFFPVNTPQIQATQDHPLLEDKNRKWMLEYYIQKYKPEPVLGQPIFIQNPRTAKIMTEIKVLDYSPSGYLLRLFQNLLLGQITPAEMLQEMARTINTALGVKV